MKTHDLGRGCISLLLTVFCLGSAAQAQPGDGPGPKDLSKAELTAMRDRIQQKADGLTKIIAGYTAADSNGDGVLSRDEIKAYADANGISLPKPRRPKNLSQAELIEMRTHIAKFNPEAANGISKIADNFAAADINGDSVLSPEEFKTYADQNGIQLPHPPRHRHE